MEREKAIKILFEHRKEVIGCVLGKFHVEKGRKTLKEPRNCY